jgi:hypothetical protein
LRGHLRGTLLVFVAIGALCAVFAGQASAGYIETGEFAGNGSGPGGSGSQPGQLSNPGQAAVLDSSGALYVADTGNNRVELFNPEPSGGGYAGAVPVTGPTGIAIDQATGDFYVAGPAGISKFNSSLSPVAGWIDPGVTGTLAVDPTTGDLLVADTAAGLIRRFEPDGTPAGTFAAERPIDLAVTNAGEVLVVTSTGPMPGDCAATSAVERFSSTGTAEGTIGASLTAPGAVAVDPDDGTIAIASVVNEYFCNGSAHPKVSFFSSAGTAIESVSLMGNTLYASVPGLALAGGNSARSYVVTKSPANDEFGNTKVVVIENLESPPAVIDTSIISATEDSAQIRAEINPEGFAAKYRFEYGLEDCAVSTCASLPASGADLSAGLAPRTVGINLTGLQAGTTYHLRVVASNVYGVDRGPDTTFRTSSPTDLGPRLPEDRAWEMVSPPDKGDYDVLYGTPFEGSYTITSDDGNKVGFNSFGAFADSKGSPIFNQYIAERSPDGWHSHSVTALQAPSILSFQRFYGLSGDLGRGLADNKFGEPGEGPTAGGLYLTNLATGATERVSPIGGGGYLQSVRGNRTWSRIVIEDEMQLLPEATNGRAVYGYSAGGALTLLSILPDGEVATNATRPCLPWSEVCSRTVSADASRVFFSAFDPAISETNSSLYLREGAVTTRVSASQRSTPDPQPFLGARFQGASEDGSVVYFSSENKLTDDSVATPTSADLYRYDVVSGELTDVTTADPSGGGLDGPAGTDACVQAVSADGNLVYFTSRANLTPGTNGTEAKFYVYDATSDSTRLIGRLAIRDSNWPQLSKDGRQIAFLTSNRVGAYQNAGRKELYRYDFESNDLSCVSCNPSGASPTGDAGGAPFVLGPLAGRLGREGRLFSADGKVVIFNTPDALVPTDTNEAYDVYLWRDGRVHLISSGTGSTWSTVMDMSPSGHDVFFATRDRLVGIDRDSSYDIYDARVGGGIAAQNPAAIYRCSGSDCQGQASSPPPEQTVATDGTPQKACATHSRRSRQLTERAKALRVRAGKATKAKARLLRKRAAQAEKGATKARACGGGSK